eukprot:12291006-Prorocentrum_lima.AAC.1
MKKLNELKKTDATKESATLAKSEKKHLGSVRPEQVNQRLIQTVQDTQNRMVFEEERTLEPVADPEVEE